MERARHRRSNNSSGIEGFIQFQKHKSVTRFSPEYRSYIDGSTTDDDMFTLELGQRSLRQASERPVKKPLAEEMYKEVESKKRTSIIARLVGLKGLSFPGHHRQQKRLSDSCQQKTATAYDGRSNRRGSMDNQELRDVYENGEASKTVDRRCSSRWSADSLLTKHEIALIEQKLKDAKSCSTNERFQGSIDLDEPSGSHIAVLKPPNPAEYEGKTKAWKTERYTSDKDIIPHVEREDGLLLEQHSRCRDRMSNQFSKIQLEEENEKKILRRKIVVLKSLGNIQDDGISDSSPDCSLGYGPHARKFEETVSCRRKYSVCDVGSSRPSSKEAREIAREITRRVRGGFEETVDEKSSAFRGYAGDGSSYEARESDFDSEIEMLKLSSRNSFGDDDSKWRRKNPSCSSVEWSIKEAKNRLSERWKITSRYQDLEIVDQSRTLGEMLAIPDKEIRAEHLTATRNDPLGISSRDGWKDEVNITSSRSRSLPPIGSHRKSTHHETALPEEKHVMCSEPIRLGRVKITNKNRINKEVFSTQDSKSIKRPFTREHLYSNERESSSDANFEIEMEANVKELSHQMFWMDEKDNTITSPVSELTTFSPHLVPKQPSSVVDKGKAAAHDQTDSILQELQKRPPEQGSSSLQYLLGEPYTSESSEADHTSPVSVFEVPSTEDTSSCSESIDRVNAELHELRMQLQLVKMETSSYADVSTLDPIEKEIAQLYSVLSEGDYLSGVEAWEILYAFDVLIESGFQECGFDIFITKWHCQECPLDPELFNNLENNYSDENTTGLRLERKLIFDRINCAFVEILQQKVALCPWVMPKLAGMYCPNEEAIDDLKNLIDRVFSNVEITDGVLDREMLRSDYEVEIDEIGNEIEELLIDEMISELISNV